MTATMDGSRRAGRKKASPTSFWTMDLGRSSSDDDVAHPPFEPRLPRVNLLPASVEIRFAARRVRRILYAVGVVLVLAFAAVWWQQSTSIAASERLLATAQDANAQIRAQVDALAPVTALYNQITDEQALVATALAAQPQAAAVVTRLVAAGSSAGSVAFDSVAVQYHGIPQSGGTLNPCPNPDPFATDITIGCITFSGTAADRAEVAVLLTTLTADPFFVGPYVNNSTIVQGEESSGRVSFTGSVGVSTDALTEPLTEEQVQEILTPPPAEDPAATTEEPSS
jgi:hypothetical protein